jgi:hypothetical protein
MKQTRRKFIRTASGLMVPAGMLGLAGIIRAGTAPSLNVAGTVRVNTLTSQGGGGGTTLNTGLIAYWKMDETGGAGTDRVDSQGANDMTANGGSITNATGLIGNCVDFGAAGSGTYLQCADNADLSFGDEDFTIAGWIYLDTVSGYQSIVDKWSSGTTKEYIVYIDAGADRIKAAISGNGTSQTDLTASNYGGIGLGAWLFIAFGHDATANEIWISVNNGTANTAAHTTGCNDNTSPLRLGADHVGTNIDGKMDEWGLWGKRLSASELTELYNSGSGKTCCPFS